MLPAKPLNRRSAPFPLAAVAAAMLGLLPSPAADAHVKWFTRTDVHTAPKPLGVVLSPIFLAVLATFTLLVFAGFLVDGGIARRFPDRLGSGIRFGAVEERLIRVAAGAYFVCASDQGLMLLTPEMPSQATWVAVVQFGVAFFLIWRPTCALSAAGVLALYAVAIGRYGIFHLTDYVFVPGLALYLLSLSLPSRRLRALREPLLVATLAFSLAWTAIEKFLYPQWTDAVIATHPSIAAGVPLAWVVVIAGFVEFTLAFYLVTGRGLLRLGGAGYALIFLSAMPPFGRIDVFGHLVILAILAIVVLRGVTPLQTAMHGRGRGVLADSASTVALYLAALLVFFALYYALQTT